MFIYKCDGTGELQEVNSQLYYSVVDYYIGLGNGDLVDPDMMGIEGDLFWDIVDDYMNSLDSFEGSDND